MPPFPSRRVEIHPTHVTFQLHSIPCPQAQLRGHNIPSPAPSSQAATHSHAGTAAGSLVCDSGGCRNQVPGGNPSLNRLWDRLGCGGLGGSQGHPHAPQFGVKPDGAGLCFEHPNIGFNPNLHSLCPSSLYQTLSPAVSRPQPDCSPYPSAAMSRGGCHGAGGPGCRKPGGGGASPAPKSAEQGVESEQELRGCGWSPPTIQGCEVRTYLLVLE